MSDGEIITDREAERKVFKWILYSKYACVVRSL